MVLWSFAILLSLIEVVLAAFPDDNRKGRRHCPPAGWRRPLDYRRIQHESSIEEHYNTAEPIGLELNGVDDLLL